MEVNHLSDSVAQVQEGIKGIHAFLASIDAARVVAENRRASAESAAAEARGQLEDIKKAILGAEKLYADAEAGLEAASAKSAAFIKGGQEESARLVDAASEKRNEIYKQIAAGNEELVQVQSKVDAANKELGDVRGKIAQAKADALKALS